MNYQDDPELADDVLLARHYKLRGSHRLKYLPTHLACRSECQLNDNGQGEPHCPPTYYINHQCFLAPWHSGPCEYSSECGVSKGAVVASQETVTVQQEEQ